MAGAGDVEDSARRPERGPENHESGNHGYATHEAPILAQRWRAQPQATRISRRRARTCLWAPASGCSRDLGHPPNVTAYFYGNSNWNQFYDWVGPNDASLIHVFRVDSPMKGNVSAADETRLSFQLATVDLAHRMMTVREVLWNAHKGASGTEITWGASTTVALSPRF